MAKLKKTTKKTKKTTKKATVKSKKAFSTYKAALDYLFSKTDYENQKHLRYNVTTFNLDKMRKLLSLLDNPHKRIKTLHIAGTKGKGSTATMLARMLEANGFKTGLYTSPHLVHLHERIVIDANMISDDEMLGLINRAHNPIEKWAKTISRHFLRS